MLNESVKPVKILMEDELNVIAKGIKRKPIGVSWEIANDLITSHRILNSRNAKLVHENDELMAENVKLTENLKSAKAMLVQSEVRRAIESGWMK